MIEITCLDVMGFTGSIKGMRNPYNTRNKSDTKFIDGEVPVIREKDLKLASTLAHSSHKSDGKFLRMIHVQFDILAPLYWWKEMDQYKVATTTNSSSTMHTIALQEFDISDFSTDHLISENDLSSSSVMARLVDVLNYWRKRYLETKKKEYWWQMIQLLPSSYNQLRTWDADYQTLQNIYNERKDHKLDEWRAFCKAIEALPYSELIIAPKSQSEEELIPFEESKNMRLEDLELPLKLHNALIDFGLTTVGDILNLRMDELTSIKGVGVKAYVKIVEAMMNHKIVSVERYKAVQERFHS